jgi:bis(5'-adenosyl)-triphosphatase
MPRGNAGDKFAGNKNDDIYPALEGARGVAPTREGGVEQLRVDADEDRKPRTPQEMETEAAWLRTFFEEQD